MSRVKGIFVHVGTGKSWDCGADTDDRVYIGVVGSFGGREFPLDVRYFKDFNLGSNVKYWLGTIWDDSVLVEAKQPYQSKPGEINDPAEFRIDLDKVDYVYVKKQSNYSKDVDDAWNMTFINVVLYGDEAEYKRFETDDHIWLGNQYGLKAWIPLVDEQIPGRD